jgi:dihydroorotate dehydrogenase
MGWYAAIGRPLFFSLPPETAHRVAGALLDAPFSRSLASSLARSADDPTVAMDLCGLPIANPIGLAAGFDKTCSHLGTLGGLGFGYVVGGTITRSARAGNAKPRIARSPATRSMVNAMGLPNPGADAAAWNLQRDRASVPRFVSVADEALDDALGTFDLLAPHADGIELNASCPNVSWGRDRDEEEHLRTLITAMRERTAKPLMVKLPPFVTEVERRVVLALASIAQEAGADALTCSNTRAVIDGRLAAGAGGLSGKALWPHTARIVAEVRAATGEAMPVNACGGIFTADDALTCLQAGAATVQVYSALIYRGPGVAGSLARELSRSLADRGLALGDREGMGSAP